MLKIKLASKRPAPPPTVPTLHRHTPSPPANLSQYERLYYTRESIIKREFALCDYVENELVRPRNEDAFKTYGYGRVVGIVDSYRKWPKHVDFPEPPALPQITLVAPIDGAASYTCTSTYVRKLTEQEIQFLEEGGVI